MSFTGLPPEILLTVGSFLSPHDLTIFVHVCRSWKDIFTPTLWKNIKTPSSWSMQEMAWQDSFDTSIDAGCVTRYGYFLCSLDLTASPFRLGEFLKRCCPSREATTTAPFVFSRLTSASLKCIGVDVDVAEFNGRCGGVDGWKSLSFDGTGASLHFGPTTAKALLKHAGTLESFTLVPGFRFPSEDIHQLLCSAPRLKKLNLVGSLQKRWPDVGGRLDAHDIIPSEWICYSLEVFRCQIGQIPPPPRHHQTYCRKTSQRLCGGWHASRVLTSNAECLHNWRG